VAVKKNKVKLDLASYPHYVIMGQRKIGKTTFFYELVKLITGSSDGGILISLGEECGFNHLEDLMFEEATIWSKEPEEDDDTRGFIQIVNDLVENRNTEWKDIKLIGLDTLDELFGIGTKQVFKEHLLAKGERCKSLNDALGGYGKGKERLLALVNEQIARLNRAGYAVFILAHTKNKLKEDAVTDKKYEIITNNLTDDLYGGVADKAQMIVNIVYDREIKENKNSDGKVVSGTILDSKRMMYFRDDNGLIDAGGRFKGLPEKLELSAENFMLAFEMGVNASKGVTLNEKQKEEIVKQEQKALEEQRIKMVQKEETSDSETKDNLVLDIKDLMKTKLTGGNKEEDGKSIKDKMSEYGLSVKELGNSTLSTLKKFYTFLKNL